MEDVDYVTVNPAVAYKRFNAVVMRYSSSEREYVVQRISQPLTSAEADALAKSWAAALQLEVR